MGEGEGLDQEGELKFDFGLESDAYVFVFSICRYNTFAFQTKYFSITKVRVLYLLMVGINHEQTTGIESNG